MRGRNTPAKAPIRSNSANQTDEHRPVERPLWVVDGSDSSTLIRCQRHHSSPPGPEPAHSQHHRSPLAAILSPSTPNESPVRESGSATVHMNGRVGVTLQGCHESLDEEVDQYAPPTKALVNCRFHSNVRWRAVCCVVRCREPTLRPVLLSDTRVNGASSVAGSGCAPAL